MITTKITLTPELAIRVGALAEHYQDSSVEIAYDDKRGEPLWQVTFEGWDEDGAPEHHRFIVNDETGEAVADTSLDGFGVRRERSLSHPDQPYVMTD